MAPQLGVYTAALEYGPVNGYGGYIAENDPAFTAWLTTATVALLCAGTAVAISLRAYRWWINRHSGWCRCGHLKSAHEHYRGGTDCGVCHCGRFRAGPATGIRLISTTAAERVTARVHRGVG